jgi:HlyD family secretion protein
MEGKRRTQVPDLVRRGLVSKNAVDEGEIKYLEAKVGLQIAESNLSRVALGATPAEVERAKMRLEAAKNELEKDRREAEAQVAGRAAAMERARAEVAHAKGKVDGAQVWLASTVLRAPRSGIVVYAKAGEGGPSDKVGLGMITREGQPILYLRDVSRMVVSTEINETDIGKVNVGAPVEARLESYPGTVFHGRVLRIGVSARVGQRRGALGSEAKVFDVTSSIEANDAQLRPGLTARIDLNVERHQNVVYIPVSAVTHGEGQPVVYVWNGGHAMRRKVVLGVSNSEHVVVKEGVRPGERLVLGSVTGGTE